MALYATAAEIQAFADEPDSLSVDAWDLLAESASRLFDRLTEVPDNFFAPYDTVANPGATAQTFYGDGTAYLKLNPFLATPTPTVAIPGGEYTVDATDITVKEHSLVFLAKTVRRPEYPYYDRYTGWHDAVPVTVTAKWGWTEVPKDVMYAVIQITLLMWRQREPATAITQGLEGVITFSLPKTAQMVVDSYKAKYSQRAMFA